MHLTITAGLNSLHLHHRLQLDSKGNGQLYVTMIGPCFRQREILNSSLDGAVGLELDSDNKLMLRGDERFTSLQL